MKESRQAQNRRVACRIRIAARARQATTKQIYLNQLVRTKSVSAYSVQLLGADLYIYQFVYISGLDAARSMDHSSGYWRRRSSMMTFIAFLARPTLPYVGRAADPNIAEDIGGRVSRSEGLKSSAALFQNSSDILAVST